VTGLNPAIIEPWAAVVKFMPVRNKTPYPKIPVIPTNKNHFKLPRLKTCLDSGSVARRRIRNRMLAIKNRKNPIVIGGASATVIFAETQDPPQKAIATMSMA
jgi:hypothetical protein